MRILLILSLLVVSFNGVKAAPPDIGDNSFFECIETEDSINIGFCFGDISWLTDKNGEDKGGEIIGLKKARRILKKAIKFFKKQKRKAKKQGDDVLADEFEAKRLNAIQSKTDIVTCYREYFDVCSDFSGGDNGDDTSFPSLSEACSLVSDPTNYGQIQRSNKRIVNGQICSDNAAATSPVLRLMLNGSQHCTGAYVAANTVLTAAHCLDGVTCDDLSVENSAASQIIGASECIMHPDYNTTSEPQAHDVAIIKLPNDFDGMTAVKVATEVTEAGADAAFAGYGRNEDDDTELRATFNAISDVSTEVISTFYTRGDTNQGTTCNGDSGGPLFVFQGGEWKTTGTLSDGSAADCALPGSTPSVDKSNWANLSSTSNQNFIKDNTEGVLD